MSTFVFAGLLALACIPVGAGLVFGYRLFVDWQDSRSYQPPAALHTDVMPWARETDKPAPEAGSVQVAPEAAETSAWVLDALARARKEADDSYATLAEFARPAPTAGALIWAEIHGRRHVQGLAVA